MLSLLARIPYSSHNACQSLSSSAALPRSALLGSQDSHTNLFDISNLVLFSTEARSNPVPIPGIGGSNPHSHSASLPQINVSSPTKPRNWFPQATVDIAPFSFRTYFHNSQVLPADVATRAHRQSHTQSTVAYETVGKDPSSLTIKSPEQSIATEILPIKSSLNARLHYTAPVQDTVRFGLVLEDFDIIAARSAYLHADGFRENSKQLAIVTAAVDTITVSDTLDLFHDYIYEAKTIQVGRSSMEVRVRLHKADDSVKLELPEEAHGPDGSKLAPSLPTYLEKYSEIKAEPLIEALFVMVALDNDNKPAIINPLVESGTSAADSKASWMLSVKEHRKRRASLRELDTRKSPPSVEESLLIHQHFLDGLDKSIKTVDASSTKVTTTMVTHLSDQNIHGRVFGGHLMKHLFDLAWTCAFKFCKTNVTDNSVPRIVAVDDVLFNRPVDIGSIMNFEASVCYNSGRCIQVVAKSTEDGHNLESASMFCTFYLQSPDGSTSKFVTPKVVSSTIKDSMDYVEARRRFRDFDFEKLINQRFNSK